MRLFPQFPPFHLIHWPPLKKEKIGQKQKWKIGMKKKWREGQEHQQFYGT